MYVKFKGPHTAEPVAIRSIYREANPCLLVSGKMNTVQTQRKCHTNSHCLPSRDIRVYNHATDVIIWPVNFHACTVCLPQLSLDVASIWIFMSTSRCIYDLLNGSCSRTILLFYVSNEQRRIVPLKVRGAGSIYVLERNEGSDSGHIGFNICIASARRERERISTEEYFSRNINTLQGIHKQ